MASKRKSAQKKSDNDEMSEEYRKKRDRNNQVPKYFYRNIIRGNDSFIKIICIQRNLRKDKV